jgi:hypothetical protein
MAALDPTITVYVALDLLAWKEQSVLVLSPKFQRRGVWSPGARSYFMDTILRGYPVPPLHLRLDKNPARGMVRDVIDGQQRLRALFEFIEGGYKLSSQLDASWAGKSYQALQQHERDQIDSYRFQIYQYQNIDDATVLEIFARINTYSVALNSQELRHGRHFGEFRQSAYSLAFKHLQFWRDARIFTEAAIARMSEAELTSELLVMQMDGLQDKKKSVDDFYRNLDEAWGTQANPWGSRTRDEIPFKWLSRQTSEKRFSAVIDTLVETVGDQLGESEFRRVPLFYTLYGAIYHRLYGLPGFDQPTPKKPLTGAERTQLRDALAQLSDLVSEKPPIDELRGWRREFLVAAARQTDNVGPRRDRLRILWEQAELAG